MNVKLTLIAFIVTALFSSCEKSDLEYENDFERSYKAWQSFKESSGNNYRYVVSQSSWTGTSSLTTITVRNGKIVQRDFVYTAINDARRPATGWTTAEAELLLKGLGLTPEEFYETEGRNILDALKWTETENELGEKNENYSSASPLYTLDDIYDKARSEWLKKRSDASISFETNNSGMISSVGFVPDGCMDDCFRGIHIQSIEGL